MRREFKEETGVDISTHQWYNFAVLNFKEAELYCFVIYDNAIYNCKTMEAENIWTLAVDTALGEFVKPLIPNLKVLIPMALDEDFKFSKIDAIVR